MRILPCLLLATTTLACTTTDGSPDAGALVDASAPPDATLQDAGASTDAAGREEPDYAAAFPQDEVPRLDLVISASEWARMQADMTDMLGAAGSGGAGGPGVPGNPGGQTPPAELFAACVGLSAGSSCSAMLSGASLSGTCTPFTDGRPFCLPAGGPGGPGGPGGGPPTGVDGGMSGPGVDGGLGPGGGGGLGDNVDLIPRTPVYAECTVSYAGRTWSHVGVRYKGNSSLAQPWMQGVSKLPLRLKFDEFEDTYPETNDQRFFGFKSLSLSNGANDDAQIRGKLASDLFAAAGLPTSATAYYRLYIDHGSGPTYFGLYTAAELPSDGAFLRTHFGTDDGNLYKPDGTGARWQTYDQISLEKENNEAAADFSDTVALYDALHADRTDAATWRAGLEARLDVAGFLKWLALNTLIQDWDQYGAMPHNYYLYADPTHGGRFSWINWDHSLALQANGIAPPLALDTVDERWPLIRLLLDDPVYAAAYREEVAALADGVFEPTRMEATIRAAHALVAPYVAEEQDGYRLSTATAFTASLDAMIAHVRSRAATASTYLGR